MSQPPRALRVRTDASGALAFVPKERYTSASFAALEWERVWMRSWLLAGPLTDLPGAGHHFTFELGHESILVLRDRAERVRAFHNVCMHRGNRLQPSGRGRCDVLRCSYHHWVYSLEGRLCGVPDRQTFPGLDERSRDLAEVRCETFGGFVWVNLDAEAQPLRDYLGPMVEELERFELQEHALFRDLTVELSCNWKAFIDNSDETYHVQAVHPHLLDLLDDFDVGPRLHPRHSSFVVRMGSPSHRRSAALPPSEGLVDMLSRAGLPASLATAPAEEVRLAFGSAVRARFRAAGIDYPRVPDDVLAHNYHGHVYPHALFNIVLPEFWLFRVRPHPDSPDRAYFDFQEYRRLAPGESRPPRPEHRAFVAGEGSVDRVVDQDTSVLAQVQRGMRSRAFADLVLGEQESRIRHLHETLDADLFELPLPPGRLPPAR